MSASQQSIAPTAPPPDLVIPADPGRPQPAWPVQRAKSIFKPSKGSEPDKDPALMIPEASPSPMTSDPGTLVMSAGISIQGTIVGAQRVVVEGTFESDRLETAELVIGRTGVFRGTAEVQSADINGRFTGDVTAKDNLSIRSNGTLSGTAQFGRLAVEDGGAITGALTPLKPRA